jgi:hypothetical protein
LWSGCGDLSGGHFSGIRCVALKRGLSFNITIDYAWLLFLEQGGKCALTGLPLTFSTQRQRWRGFPQTASLDRIDSSRGYEPDNVWWVHKDVNMMKKEYSLERFIEICHCVSQTHAISTSMTALTVAQ